MLNACVNHNTDQHQQMLLLRDAMLFSLLWQSYLRGFSAVALRLDNIVLPNGESALPNRILMPTTVLSAGAMLASAASAA